MSDSPQPPRRAGRPRREGADAAILAAAIELVRERGYGAVTLDEIGRRAGVAKTTLYRRWASKAALVGSALNALIPPLEPLVPAEGDPLHQQLLALAGLLQGDLGRVLAALAVEETEQPEAAAVIWRVLRPEGFTAIAESRGLSSDALVGAIWLRAVVFGEEVSAEFVAALVQRP